MLLDDFRTPKKINDWVNEKTNGMINNILDEIDDDFVLGLANALAVDVEWELPFDCGDTTGQEFTKLNGKTFKTEMMHKTLSYEGYQYLKNNNAIGIIVPYKSYNKLTGEYDNENGRTLEFVGILPETDINSYINNLTDEELNNLFASSKHSSDDLEIRLSIPRFKYDYTLDNFAEVLMSLGIKDAFDMEKANFTKMMPRNGEVNNLYIGTAVHKTHINLNEKGTKAAAVTFFGMKNTSMMPEEKESVSITFDKPFIYMIRDKNTKEMLFFGVVYEPNKWNGSTCSVEK